MNNLDKRMTLKREVNPVKGKDYKEIVKKLVISWDLLKNTHTYIGKKKEHYTYAHLDNMPGVKDFTAILKNDIDIVCDINTGLELTTYSYPSRADIEKEVLITISYEYNGERYRNNFKDLELLAIAINMVLRGNIDELNKKIKEKFYSGN